MGDFEEHITGNINKDISFLNGVLVALQFVNHKTDGIFNFSLKEIVTKHGDISPIDLDPNDSKIKILDSADLKLIMLKWLFNFVEGEHHVHSRIFVKDRAKQFSHSCKDYRASFVSEFVECLIKATGAIRIHSANIMGLGTENDMVFLESESKRFVLSLSWDN